MVSEMGKRSCQEHRLIMDAISMSNAAYDSTLAGAISELNRAISGGVELLHHQGFNHSGAANQPLLCCQIRDTGRIIVSCRGTSSIGDVVQDLKFLPARLSGVHDVDAVAHWGFAQRAAGIALDPFLELIDSGKSITFTGHSLGGAVASLVALRMLRELDQREEMEAGFAKTPSQMEELTIDREQRIKCITFGAPLFAGSHLAELITARYSAVYLHVVQHGDCVPELLPFFSTMKRLFSDDDHWEGFRLLHRAISYVLPSIASSIAAAVPSPIGLVLRSALRLALIPRSLSYGFAGKILTLDPSSRSFRISGSDRFNAWHAQLAMAIRAARSAVRSIHHHSLLSYESTINHAIRPSCSCLDHQNHDISRRRLAVAASIDIAADAFLGHCICRKLKEPHQRPSSRRFQWLGSLLGRIGRISRQLRAVQTMCVYTLFNTAFTGLWPYYMVGFGGFFASPQNLWIYFYACHIASTYVTSTTRANTLLFIPFSSPFHCHLMHSKAILDLHVTFTKPNGRQLRCRCGCTIPSQIPHSQTPPYRGRTSDRLRI